MALTYLNARRILKNEEARVAQSAGGIYDENSVVLFWDNVEARYINECIEYLNQEAAQVLANPQFYDVVFSDTLYHLHAFYDEAERTQTGKQRLYRVMMRSPIEYTEQNWSQTLSKWRWFAGRTYDGGRTNGVLIMRNVLPEEATKFQTQALDDVYTDLIYLVRGELLSGSWHSDRRETEVDPKTGLYTVKWFISNSDSQIYKDEDTVVALPDEALMSEESRASEEGNPAKQILRFGTVGHEVKDEFGIETETLPVFNRVDSDLDNGTYRKITRLMGVQSQIPELTLAGKWNWRLNTEIFTVPDTDWHIQAIGREQVKTDKAKTISWQQVRRLIGGDLSFNKDAKTGQYTGVDWNVQWNNGMTFPSATAPANWVSHGYQARYGAWRPYWTQGFLTGAGSIRGRAEGAGTVRGFKDSYSYYNIGDVVWWNQGEVFQEAVSHAVPLGSDWQADKGNTETLNGTIYLYDTYAVGDVVLSGGRLYTCISSRYSSLVPPDSKPSSVVVGFSVSSSTSENPTVLSSSSSSSNSPQYADQGGINCWVEGALAYQITWNSLDVFEVRNLVSKIALNGVGVYPFELPDNYIPVLEGISEEVDWNSDWSWNADAVYTTGDRVFYEGDQQWYVATQDAPDPNFSPDNLDGWEVATEDLGPTSWADGYYDARYGVWRAGWTRGFLIGSGSVQPGTWGATECQGILSEERTYQKGDVVWDPEASEGAGAFKVARSLTGYPEWEYQTDVQTAAIPEWVSGTPAKFGYVTYDGAIYTPKIKVTFPGGYTYNTAPNIKTEVILPGYPGVTFEVLNTTTPSPEGWTLVGVVGAAVSLFDKYNAGDCVESGGKFFTCSSKPYSSLAPPGSAPIEVLTGAGVSSGGSDDQSSGAWSLSGSNNPDFTRQGGTGCWSEGAYGASITWGDMPMDQMVSKIARSGLGTWPFEGAEKVGVMNEAGVNAVSSSSRVSFYTNPHENPEMFEAGQRLKHTEDVFVLRTFFALDPIWVKNKRIPQAIFPPASVVDVAGTGISSADISIGAVFRNSLADKYYKCLSVPGTPATVSFTDMRYFSEQHYFGNELFHPGDPNVSAEFKTIQVGDLWAIEAIIRRVGEKLSDEPVQSSNTDEGASVVNGKAQMDGALRNFPQVDGNGFWGIYHRVNDSGSYTGQIPTTGKPAGAYKDAG